jgi:S-formylglutathione hydrolase FrmB
MFMAFMEIKLRSKVLGLCTAVNVILPEHRTDGRNLKVLWLLHGLSDDNTAWCRNTSIERYVENKNICVIMPAVDRSFYSDMVYGNRYYSYISAELPKMMKSMLPISMKKEDNFVAGLSMGGYGAFKLALNQPERFEAAASLSGALDIFNIYKASQGQDDIIVNLMRLIHGDEVKIEGTPNDLRHMAALRKEEGNLPNLYICCGKNDFLYESNLMYLEYLKSLGIDVVYEEEEGYAHTWDYWDLKIQRILEWMGLNS